MYVMILQMHRPQSGFTIAGVIVAVAILAILTALAVKPMNGFIQRMRLQNAAEGLKHLILNARVRATANTQIHCGIAFHANLAPTSDSAFAFFDRSKPANNSFDPGTDSLYLRGVEFKAKDKIQLTIPPGYPTDIAFRGDGSANLSAKVVLTLGKLQDTVDVLASTGRVKVKVK